MKSLQRPANFTVIFFYTLLNLAGCILIIQADLPIYLSMLPIILIIPTIIHYPLSINLTMVGITTLSSIIIGLFKPGLSSSLWTGTLIGDLTLILTILILKTQIQKRQELEDDLRKNQERLEIALSGTGDGIWEWTINNNSVYLSPNFAEKIQFKAQNANELIENPELFNKEDFPVLAAAYEQYLRGEKDALEAEVRMGKNKGEWNWTLIRGKITEYDENNLPVRMIGTLTNIQQLKKIEQDLKTSESNLRQLTENMQEIFWLRDRETHKLIYITPRAEIETTANTDIVYSNPYYFFRYIHPDDRERVRSQQYLLYEAGTPFKEEYRFQHRDGSTHWIITRQYPVYNSQGEFYRVAGISQDITDRKKAEIALQKSEKRFRDMINHQSVAVGVIDQEGNFLFNNPAISSILATPGQTLLGSNLLNFVCPKQRDLFPEKLKNLQSAEEIAFEFEIKRMDGQRRILAATITPQLDETNSLHTNVLVLRDITEQKQQEEELLYLSSHDSLTGLYNRAFFDKEMARLEDANCYPIGLIMIDLDRLKETNDRFGHSKGDQFLSNVATILKNSFRAEDILARIGGDEFVAIMPNATEELLKKVIQRIYENIQTANANPIDGQPLLYISAGSALCESRGSLKEALHFADLRMYVEKLQKKSRRK